MEMDCTESSCDTVIYETFPVRVVTGFVKITLDEKCTEGGIGGFREIRALSVVHDGKAIHGTCVWAREGEKKRVYTNCAAKVQRLTKNTANKTAMCTRSCVLGVGMFI